MSKRPLLDKIAPVLDELIDEHVLCELPEHMQKAHAFRLWCHSLLLQHHHDLDTDPLDLPDSRDGGVDLAFDDPANKRLIIVQCKYVGQSGKYPIDGWGRFCELVRKFGDEDAIRLHDGSAQVGEELQRFSRLLRDDSDYSIDFYFITTAPASDRFTAQAAQLSDDSAGGRIRVHLWDHAGLLRKLRDADAREAEAVDCVEVEVPDNRIFSIDCGSSTAHVFTLKATKVATLYDKYQQRLLAWNIRNYLGANAINKRIRDTARDNGREFFLCNNGVTCISRTVTKTNDGKHIKLALYKFQVINGGQTIASINEVHKTHASVLSAVDVLFTVIETPDTSPTSSFNARLIQARNTQNRVNLSDFRSNDPVQLWLERELPKAANACASMKGLPSHLRRCVKLFYKRKRDFHRKSGHEKLELEQLAKIRYAYLHEPWTVMAYVNQLWTRSGDEDKPGHPGKSGKGKHDAGGKYERAFGVEQADSSWKLESKWERRDLEHCMFAVLVYRDFVYRIEQWLAANPAVPDSPQHPINLERIWLKRSRFHLLAVVGKQYRDRDVKKFLKDGQALMRELDLQWRRAHVVCKNVINSRLASGVGRDTILRSPDDWACMCENLAGFA